MATPLFTNDEATDIAASGGREIVRRRLVGLRYIGAIELTGALRKIKLPADVSVNAEIDLNPTAPIFSARFSTSACRADLEVAQTLVHAVHDICPYSKATRGNIAVETTLI